MKDRRCQSLGIALGGVAIGFLIGRGSVTDDADGGAHAKTLAQSRLSAPASPIESAPFADQRLAAASTNEVYERWQRLQHRPMTPEAEDDLCAYLRELGASNSSTALKLAAEATTPRLRELCRNAALHGWATRVPRAAAEWALAHVRSQERRAAVEAIAAGAVAHPEAMPTFQHLIASDPQLASDHGNALVGAFARAGQFKPATEFAAAGASPFRAAWLANAYHAWAVCQPEEALATIDNISDPAVRREALGGLFAGWGSCDPARLVAYAQTLPVGELRLNALREGLTQWVYRDSAAASDWMDKFDPSPDLDAGAAAIAIMPALVENKPDVAASWAESISDPELRAHTLLDLIRLWAEHDAVGAYKYADTSPALRPETRALARSLLQPQP